VSQLPVPTFAAIGHQESWSQIEAMVQALRTPAHAPLTSEQVREIVPWIPARTVSRLTVVAAPDTPVHGIYVETFITPSELALRPTRRLLDKVREGIRAAQREGARLATLGGFTSILMESMRDEPMDGLALTTGNTLTAALIVRGVERAACLLGRRLEEETLLIIGASGDVGSACARHFAGRTRRLLLAARNAQRLERKAAPLRTRGPVDASTDVLESLPRATLVICAASTAQPAFELERCSDEAIVCDAGYPKNIRVPPAGSGRRRVFWGGMGTLAGRIRYQDSVCGQFYRFPVADTAHGCMLEGAVLALASRFEPFSSGRGRITPERIEEMWRLAEGTGVAVAPLFDGRGLWPEEMRV
jgi:fatty aldehyde-generating acyl-ACP reductase